MDSGARAKPMKTAAAWLGAAVVLFFISSALELRTPVEIYSTGGRVDFTVAGTTLSVPLAISSVSGVEIEVSDSVFPPGGEFIEFAAGETTVVDERLPSRFDIPDSPVVPLGDWELDDDAASAVVFGRAVEVNGPFTLRAAFRGRSLHHTTITLRGDPTIRFQLRRGMINNDLFIRDVDDEVIAVTTIDPQPLRNIGNAAATLLRGATAAAVLLACCAIVGFRKQSADPGNPNDSLAPTPDLPRWLVVTVVAFLVILAIVRSLWIGGHIFGGLPHQPDSVAYLQQANWLAEGRLSAAQPAAHEHMHIPYTYFVNDRWVSHYPVGWPLLLSIGLAVSAPSLIPALLAGLFTLVLYALGRELFDQRTALLAVVLASFSPMAGLMFGCHLSHSASSTAIAAFLFLLVRARRTGKLQIAVLAGLCVGYAFAVRPLTAVAVALPCAVLLLMSDPEHASRRVQWGVFLGGALAAIPTLLHNASVTGNPLTFPYTLAKGTMYGAAVIPFGLRNMDALLAHTVPAIFGWGWGLVSGWIFLALPLAFAWIPFLTRRTRRYDLLLIAVFAAVVVAHVGTRAHGLHGFGPRYYFDAFCCLYLLTARGFRELARYGPRPSSLITAAIFIVLTASTVARLPERFELYRGYNQVSGCLHQQLAEEAPDFGLVLFEWEDWRNWAEAAPMLSTDPFADLVFAQLTDDNRILVDLYGDRPAWLWDGTTLRTLPEDWPSLIAGETPAPQ